MRYISVNQAEQATSGHHAAVLGNGVAQQDTKRAERLSFFIGGARTFLARRKFHYTTWLEFCQEKNCTNFKFLKSQILCNIPVLHFPSGCAIL